MSFSVISTISSINTKISQSNKILSNYFYPFTNSSDLNNGYILNYSTNAYDLSAVNITSANFYANGVYFPTTPSTYCINSQVIVNNSFTIVQKYTINTYSSNRRLFTLKNAANLLGINIRIGTTGILTAQQTTTTGTAYSTANIATNNSDTLVCVYTSNNNFTCYTNSNSAGVSCGGAQVSIASGTNMILVIGTLIQSAIVANNNFSVADVNQLISSFRFYNRTLSASEITGALAGTYPST
jgi:hypothetical protein